MQRFQLLFAVLCHPSNDCNIFCNPITTRKGTLPRSEPGGFFKPSHQQSVVYPTHHAGQSDRPVFTGTFYNRNFKDVAPFLKSLGGTPDKSHRFICVTRSVLLIACTCASLILSGPGAPFLALHSTLVALDSVTTSNRSSFSGYAIAGVLLSSSEGGSDKVFQNGITLSRGRLLDSSAHVPRMTTLAVSDWRSRQSPWSLAYLSRFACLLLIFLPSSFLVWAAFCPFRLFTFLARNLQALGALCFIRSSSFVSQALYSSETVGSLQKRFRLRISNATQLVAHCGGEIRELS